MYTINNRFKNEIIIKNSRFITILVKIKNKEQIKEELEQIKKEFPKATHYCYAYILNELKKSSDDKEPGGTAGIQILSVLEKEKLNFVLAVVVRYFGGIKLGTGGLSRAYSKSIRDLIEKINLIKLEKGKKLILEFNYNQEKNIDYLLKSSKIINKIYKELITYEVLVNDNTINNLINNNIIFTVIDNNIYIEKET